MNRTADQPEPNPLREGLSARAVPQPCAIVIFGATGDLTHRKLVPALYNLAADGDLPPAVTIVGFARRPKTDDEFRTDLEEATRKFSRQPCAMKFGKILRNRSFIIRASSRTKLVTRRWLNASMKSIRTTAPAAIAFFISPLLPINSSRFSRI